MELNLDERVRKTPVAPPAVDFEAKVKKSKRWYFIWWAAMPTVVFIAAFAVLCMKECTALPWATFLFAPVVSIALGLLWAVVYWLKSSSLPDEPRRDTRRFILLSILWGPFLGLAVFYALAMVISIGGSMVAVFT